MIVLGNHLLLSVVLLNHPSYGLLESVVVPSSLLYVVQGLCWLGVGLALLKVINLLLGLWLLRFLGIQLLWFCALQIRKMGDPAWTVKGLVSGVPLLAVAALGSFVSFGQGDLTLDVADPRTPFPFTSLLLEISAFTCTMLSPESQTLKDCLLGVGVLVCWLDLLTNPLMRGADGLLYRLVLASWSVQVLLAIEGSISQGISGTFRVAVYLVAMPLIGLYCFFSLDDSRLVIENKVPLPLLEVLIVRLLDSCEPKDEAVIKTFILKHEQNRDRVDC